MSNAQMMNPQRMYGGKPNRLLTPAQRRRVHQKLRRLYGWDQDKREAWIARERAEGRPVR